MRAALEMGVPLMAPTSPNSSPSGVPSSHGILRLCGLALHTRSRFRRIHSSSAARAVVEVAAAAAAGAAADTLSHSDPLAHSCSIHSKISNPIFSTSAHPHPSLLSDFPPLEASSAILLPNMLPPYHAAPGTSRRTSRRSAANDFAISPVLAISLSRSSDPESSSLQTDWHCPQAHAPTEAKKVSTTNPVRSSADATAPPSPNVCSLPVSRTHRTNDAMTRSR
jgi:hypothetical protein